MQVILGHESLAVTEVYAAKNVAAARKIMGEVGQSLKSWVVLPSSTLSSLVQHRSRLNFSRLSNLS